MQLNKEMLIFYSLLIASAGIIIAAEQPSQKNVFKKESIKCCSAPMDIPAASPLNIITEGLLRFNA